MDPIQVPLNAGPYLKIVLPWAPRRQEFSQLKSDKPGGFGSPRPVEAIVSAVHWLQPPVNHHAL
jgi:hypothetical protein